MRSAIARNPLERSTNCWIAADEFLGAFPTLRLDDGLRLVCVCTCWEDERQSRLIAVRLPPDELLPELPVALREHDLSTCFREVETPAELPDWVRWDVGSCVRDDGSARGLFERSLFHLWIGEVLNSGHNVYWGRARVLAEPAEVVRREQASGGLRPSYSGTKVLGLPEDLTPRVRRNISGDRAAEFLPDDPAGRARLASSPAFSLVEFYSYIAYVQRTVYRHRLWFVGGECIGGTLDGVAELGAGYVV